MNITTILGVIAAVLIFLGSSFLALGSFEGLFDSNSMLIVVGGSIAATVIAVPVKALKLTVSLTLSRVIKKEITVLADIVEDILTLANAKRKGTSAFDAACKNVRNEFLMDAASILFWADAEVSTEEFRDLLETRADTFVENENMSVKTYKVLGKFPPAYGMMGTVVGLIALLQSLDSPDAKSMLGPAMAVALITTLYGIVINNLFIIPLGEKLKTANEKGRISFDIVIEGLILIQMGRPRKYIEEKLNSFLMPDERGSEESKKAA